ncbi:hypothetical protein SEEH8319_08940, partial [Salmonella enterica subsp. enterica serovar Heidelberg str. 579083-19]
FRGISAQATPVNHAGRRLYIQPVIITNSGIVLQKYNKNESGPPIMAGKKFMIPIAMAAPINGPNRINQPL